MDAESINNNRYSRRLTERFKKYNTMKIGSVAKSKENFFFHDRKQKLEFHMERKIKKIKDQVEKLKNSSEESKEKSFVKVVEKLDNYNKSIQKKVNKILTKEKVSADKKIEELQKENSIKEKQIMKHQLRIRDLESLNKEYLFKCYATYDYTKRNDDELSFKEGDVITVLQEGKENKVWHLGRVNNDPREGLFPENFTDYLKVVERRKKMEQENTNGLETLILEINLLKQKNELTNKENEVQKSQIILNDLVSKRMKKEKLLEIEKEKTKRLMEIIKKNEEKLAL